ncbi:hypothetical protein IAQ61_005093, partial [Plenodomus lingam]
TCMHFSTHVFIKGYAERRSTALRLFQESANLHVSTKVFPPNSPVRYAAFCGNDWLVSSVLFVTGNVYTQQVNADIPASSEVLHVATSLPPLVSPDDWPEQGHVRRSGTSARHVLPNSSRSRKVTLVLQRCRSWSSGDDSAGVDRSIWTVTLVTSIDNKSDSPKLMLNVVVQSSARTIPRYSRSKQQPDWDCMTLSRSIPSTSRGAFDPLCVQKRKSLALHLIGGRDADVVCMLSISARTIRCTVTSPSMTTAKAPCTSIFHSIAVCTLRKRADSNSGGARPNLAFEQLLILQIRRVGLLAAKLTGVRNVRGEAGTDTRHLRPQPAMGVRAPSPRLFVAAMIPTSSTSIGSNLSHNNLPVRPAASGEKSDRNTALRLPNRLIEIYALFAVGLVLSPNFFGRCNQGRAD